MTIEPCVIFEENGKYYFVSYNSSLIIAQRGLEEKNLDLCEFSLVADETYIEKSRVGPYMLRYFSLTGKKGDIQFWEQLCSTLTQLDPNIRLDRVVFNYTGKYYVLDIKELRKFLQEFSLSHKYPIEILSSYTEEETFGFLNGPNRSMFYCINNKEKDLDFWKGIQYTYHTS